MLTDFIDRRTANVYGIYGNLGGGKTLTSVEVALWALKLGWSVSSNVYIKHVENYGSKYTFIPDFQQVDFWQLPQGAPRGSKKKFRSVIIIDEVAEFFDQFTTNSPVVKSFLSWLRHSSKRGQFVFMIVQRPEFLNKSLRIIINKWIICDDLDQVRMPVLKIKFPFCGDLVMRKVVDRWGNVISRGFNTASKKYFGQFYETSQSIALEGRDNDFVCPDDSPPGATHLFECVVFLALLYLLLTFGS